MFFVPVMLTILLTGVVFVNGWTDAPNAITCVVATGALPYRRAAALAAVCNLAGIAVMSLISTSVADTMLGVADFSGAEPSQAVLAICAAMLSIIVFAVTAWIFGIPTSESHALIAALTGASLAAGAGGVSAESWRKVLLGLVLSLVLGLAFGYLLSKTLGRKLAGAKEKSLDRAQILGAGAMAFMHGAQDGQKFAAVFVVTEWMVAGQGYSGAVRLQEHIPALLLCAAAMSLGTAVGGGRIVATVGGRMVSVKKPEAVCADIGGALCLLAASLTGIPMSTTHAKTTAIMGAGAAGVGRLNRGVVKSMFWAWGITFPVCGALGYLLTRLLLWMA